MGEGFNTQVITLWCFNIVGREILTLGVGFNTQVYGNYPMVFQHSGSERSRLTLFS
jgi:hypothetical protein